jgi:hypothetical protein
MHYLVYLKVSFVNMTFIVNGCLYPIYCLLANGTTLGGHVFYKQFMHLEMKKGFTLQ